MFINRQNHFDNKKGLFRNISRIIHPILFIFFFVTLQLFFCSTNNSFAQQNSNASSDKKLTPDKDVVKINPQNQAVAQNTEATPESKGIYNVKKYDTLWDISDKELKSPKKWPALWGQNPHIRNPHWIYPGETIYINKQEDLNSTGQSFSPPASAPYKEPVQKVGVNPPYYYFYPLMDSVGYIKEKAVNPVGKIIACMPRYQKEIDRGNGVYLEIKNESDLMVGDQFQILRTFYIRNKNSTSFPLVHHYITGIVEITKLKPKPCKCHEQIAQVEGKIITAYRTILPNDILVPYNSVNSKILVRQSNEEMNARILFSEDHKDKIVENSVVFIDKGKSDGLKIGQFYDIVNHPKGELIDSDQFIEKIEYIGSLVVLRLEEQTSTALITYAYKDITPGDIMVSPIADNAFSNIPLTGHYR